MSAPMPTTPPNFFAPPPVIQFSPAAIATLVLVGVQTITLLGGRLIAVNLTYNDGPDPTAIATTFGVLGLLSIVLIAAAIVLGHVALRQIRGGTRRGQLLAAVALGAGYLHLLLWLNRIALAAIASGTDGDPGSFLPNVFWWA